MSVCRHFGSCGGCASQNIGYDQQLETKKEQFKHLLAPYYKSDISIVGSPSAKFYRNKMEFAFWQHMGELRLGLKQRGQWKKVVDLNECLIFDSQTGQLLEEVRQWTRQESLSIYDGKRHQGFLRYLVLRKGFEVSGQRPHLAVMIVSTSQRRLPWEPLRDRLLSLFPEGNFSLIWGLHDLAADVAQTQKIETIFGEPFLKETLLGIPFRYGVLSFFQTNPKTFELLLQDLVKEIKRLEVLPKRILDLYCGVGVIAITLHRRLALPTLGVETVNSSIEDATYNGGLTPDPTLSFPSLLPGHQEIGKADGEVKGWHKKISFILDKVENKAQELLGNPESKEALVVLDPPRCGIHPKVRRALLSNPPRNLFYVSCNPELTVRQDLPQLCQSYKIVFTKAYDFFPHTNHYEAFFILQRNS